MLTTDDFGLNDYVFKSSPESCSDQSYSSDFMDVTSDEDFITQLSADLDIPLLLNPGEDELSMLNSFFDKSPEEIMAEITSPRYKDDDFIQEINELCDVDVSKCSPEAFPNLQRQIKKEMSSGSSSPGSDKSPSPIAIDVKEEVYTTTPPVSPRSIIINTTSINELPGNMLYAQPMQIVTSPTLKITKPCSKQVPIVPKTTFPIVSASSTKNNPVLIKQEIKPIITNKTTPNIVLLDKTAVTQITTIPSSTVPTTVSIPSVMIDSGKRFSLSGHIDPKILKKQQRKIKNRESASLSRKRKKDYVTSLEERVKELTTDNDRLVLENAQLKERLAQYEESVPNQSSKRTIRPSLFLCIFLLVIGVNLDLLRNPFSTRNEINLIKDIPKLPDHHGRNLLWAAEEQDTNKTSNFSPFSMCPATVNQTETARLVLELERWIGKPADGSTKVALDKNTTAPAKVPRLRQRKRKYKIDSPLMSAYKRYRYKTEQQNLSEEPRNEIQVFSLRADQIYTEFFEAINRQDDTFYVVSFTEQHMLLPALSHNKTRRPKMSLIMPSMLLNDTVSQGSLIPLMKIDCEVVDTSMIHVKHASIPQHLRTAGNTTKPNSASADGDSTDDGMNYYKKPYKPYFINKKTLRPEKNFFNIN